MQNVEFRMKTFKRRILPEDAVDVDVSWSPATLRMYDAYGGPTRCVLVHMAWTIDSVLLKCVEPLAKCEFEELFGFGCGGFKLHRVISLDKDAIAVS